MVYCEECGRPTERDDVALCDACLSDEWERLRRHANLWDVDRLRLSVEDPPRQLDARGRGRGGHPIDGSRGIRT